MNSKRELSQSFEYTGYWWPGARANRALGGTLRYDPAEGCSLDIYGNFGSDGEVKIIRGISSTNERITLIHCRRVSETWQGTFTIQRFACQLALVGNYHPTPNLKFKECNLRLQQLDSWTAAAYVTRSGPDQDGNLSLTVQPNRQGTLTCSNKRFNAHLEGSYESRIGKQVIHLDAHTSLRIQPEADQTLRWFLDKMRTMRDLVGLCFGSPLPLQSMSLLGDNLAITGSISERQQVQAFFLDSTHPWTPTPRAYFPLVMFKRVETIAPDILSTWYARRKSLQETIDLTFLVLNGHYNAPQVGFLIIMQAFEAFDRATFPRKVVSDKIFTEVTSAMKESIPEGVPAELRAKLKSSIEYANEPSLRQRLKDFHASLVADLGKDPLGLKKSKIGTLVDTRNYFTHYPKGLKKKRLTQHEIAEETYRFT